MLGSACKEITTTTMMIVSARPFRRLEKFAKNVLNCGFECRYCLFQKQERWNTISSELRDLVVRLEHLREAASTARNGPDMTVLTAITAQIETLSEKHAELVQEQQECSKYLTGISSSR